MSKVTGVMMFCSGSLDIELDELSQYVPEEILSNYRGRRKEFGTMLHALVRLRLLQLAGAVHPSEYVSIQSNREWYAPNKWCGAGYQPTMTAKRYLLNSGFCDEVPFQRAKRRVGGLRLNEEYDRWLRRRFRADLPSQLFSIRAKLVSDRALYHISPRKEIAGKAVREAVEPFLVDEDSFPLHFPEIQGVRSAVSSEPVLAFDVDSGTPFPSDMERLPVSGTNLEIFEAYRRTFDALSLIDPEYGDVDPAAFDIRRTLYRIDGKLLPSRYFCAASNFPSSVRRSLYFHGEPTVEIDFVACAPRIILGKFAKVGVEDPYTQLFYMDREEAKKAFTFALGARKGMTERICSSRDDEYFGMFTDRDVRQVALQFKMWGIQDLMVGDTWMLSQVIESEMARRIITGFHERCPGRAILPIHDSFVVPWSDHEALKQIMHREWFKTVGTKPVLRVEYGLEV